MDEDIQQVIIDYDVNQNRFMIKLNDTIFYFSPNRYMDFVQHSIVAINSIIAERFSNSLKSFMEGAENTETSKKKKTFTKKDCETIANEVEQWFKEHPVSG